MCTGHVPECHIVFSLCSRRSPEWPACLMHDGIVPCSEKPADYLAASKAWEKVQAGKYVIYTEEYENESTLRLVE